VGRLNKTLDKIVIGRGLAAIRSKSDHQSYLYYQLRHHFFKEDLIGGGAIFASVTKEHLLSQELLTATESLIREFEDVIRPIDRQIELLFMENQKLRQARDILLPKLMNGEIEVDNLSTKRLV
jgi:type I restriction enzyme S subunit